MNLKIHYFFIILITSLFINAKQLNFLFIVEKFPWYTQNNIANYIKGLSKKGHKVSIFSRSYGHKNSLQIDTEYSLFSKKLPANLKKYDVVICADLFLANFYADLKNKLKKNAKFITRITGQDIEIIRSNKNLLIKNYDIFLATDGFTKYRSLIEGIPEKDIIVHYSPIDLDELPFRLNIPEKNRTITILIVHELCDYKSIETVIRVMRGGIIKFYPQVRCIVIGDGPMKNELETLIAKNERAQPDLKGKIILKGWLSHKKVLDWMNKAHMLIVPTAASKDGVRDGLSNTLKEAMALGLPIIATRHPANLEAIESDYSGLLVPERDTTWMGYCFRHMMRKQEYWLGWALEGRQRAMKMFDLNKCVDEFLEIVKK